MSEFGSTESSQGGQGKAVKAGQVSQGNQGKASQGKASQGKQTRQFSKSQSINQASKQAALFFVLLWGQANELFTPEPFLANASDAYRHHLSLTRTQHENIPHLTSITQKEESIYEPNGALPVRPNKAADDLVDQNAIKSLDELKKLNALRDMMDDHYGGLVGPPSDYPHRRQTMRITTGGKDHMKEHQRQHGAAQDAKIDDDPRSDRAQHEDSY
jgi:hypothetical protein